MNYNISEINEIFKKISYHTFSGENNEPPIACVAVHKEDARVLFSARNMELPIMPTKNKYNKVGKWRRHAELKVINMIKSNGYSPDEFDYLISFQPCNGCTRLFKKNGVKKVHFLVDKGFKSDEEELGGIEIVKLEPRNSFQRRVLKKITPRVKEVIWD